MQSNKSKSVLNQFWLQTELGMLTCDRMINDNKSHMLHYSMVLFIFTTIFFSEVSLYAKRYLMQNHILHYLFRYLSLEVDNAFTLYLTFEKWNTKNISKRFHVILHYWMCRSYKIRDSVNKNSASNVGKYESILTSAVHNSNHSSSA